MGKFIVAEITKNWPGEEKPLLSQKFEKVINVNFVRGYELMEWKLSSCISIDVQSETIVAIFKKRHES